MTIPLWLKALGAALLAQAVSTFMGQSLPVLAPLLTASAGVAPERIGNLSSISSFASIAYMAFGSPILARLGPVASLQMGTAIAVVGLGVAATGSWVGLVAGALLMGIGYGPTPPAGSRMLQATAPAGHRSLIFSIKQAGAPAGGALSGLLIAPLAVAFGGVVALGAAMAAGVASVLAIGPLRRALDADREPGRSVHPRVLFGRRNLAVPFAALRRGEGLLPLTALAFSFAVLQGALFSFSVTYLTQRGMSLAAAGFAFACLQAAGTVARILLGWVADRTGHAAANLVVQAFLAAGAVVAYALMPLDAPLWLVAVLAGAAGFFGASWNGIYLAEVARLAPPGGVADATAGSTMLCFMGYVIGPTLFAAAVPWLGWSVPFLLCAGQMAAMGAVMGVLLLRGSRRYRGQ
jgi:MFS family permease